MINADIDVDATGVMEGACGVGDVADRIVQAILETANACSKKLRRARMTET